jgi:hypothetical protein
VPQ